MQLPPEENDEQQLPPAENDKQAMPLPEGETEPSNELNVEVDGTQYQLQENEDGTGKLIPVESEDVGEDEEFYRNLVDAIGVGTNKLTALGAEFLDYVDIDKEARKKRDEQYAQAIKRAGLGEEAPGGADFEGANKVTHPLMSEATVDFAARAIKELCPPDGPVKTKILGKSTPEKFQKADRKARHMNWQLMTQMPEFRPCLEQILTQCALSGVQYSKTYHWKRGRRSKFEYIPMDDVYVPFHAPNFYSASRKTHAQRLNKLEFEERVASELYYDYEINDSGGSNNDEVSKSEQASRKIEGKEEPPYDADDLRTVYEIYCYLELDEDAQTTGDYKYAPYIMTIDEPTGKVLSIYRNWDPSDPSLTALEWIVEWSFIPWRGAYAIGLSHLIGGLAATATGTLRALLDSGHINNAPTALKLKGAQIGGQSQTIAMTQIQEIEGAPGVDDIRKIAMPLPFNPPSSVLLELLGIVVQYGKGVVTTAIESNPNYSPNTPVGTEMSRVDQGMAVYSAIHARLHESMKHQLAIQHRLNGLYLEENSSQLAGDVQKLHSHDMDDETSTPLAFKEDYQGEMDVQPISDPNIFSDVQRVAQMQSVGQLITQFPIDPATQKPMYDIRAYNKRMLQLLKVPGIDELLPEPPEPTDENPATENIKMSMGVPASVLPEQDHLAHLQVLVDYMKDPCYGANPAIRPKFIAPAVAHAVQHLLFLYGDEVKSMIEQAAGKPIEELMGDTPELKELMSKTVAAASPLALKSTNGLLQGIMPILEQAFQDAQKLVPPPPMDPSQASIQTAQLGAQTQQAKIASDEKVKLQELQTSSQADQAKIQADLQTAAQQMQSDQQIESLKAQTILQKNTADNNTALQIASMKIETGVGGAGNIKDGTSLGTSYSEGGLVVNSTDYAKGGEVKQPIHVNVNAPNDIISPLLDSLERLHNKPDPAPTDLSPLIQAISANKPQPHQPQDLTPIVQAIHATKTQPTDLSSVISAIQASKPEPPDLSSVHEALGRHKDEIQNTLSSIVDGINETGKRLHETHQEMMDNVKKKKGKNVKFTTTRDDKGNLTGGIIED